MCANFFATLEGELLQRRKLSTTTEARTAISEFIWSWYNPGRRHSTQGHLSTIDYDGRAR